MLKKYKVMYDSKSKYDLDKYPNVIYFTEDTNELLFNGSNYSDSLDENQIKTIIETYKYLTLEDLETVINKDYIEKLGYIHTVKTNEGEELSVSNGILTLPEIIGIPGTDGEKGKDGKDGLNGTDGVNGITPYIGENLNWFTTEDTGIRAIGRDGKNGLNGKDGNDGKAPFVGPNGNWWIGDEDTGVKAEGKDGKDGTNGLDGEDGIKGEDGKDGTPSYVHIAYADDDKGNGFSQSPTDKTYVGIYTDSISIDSNDPSKYKWALMKGLDGLNGKDGLAGKPGSDGRTSYTHFAYANSEDGKVDFSIDNPKDRSYLGIYTDFEIKDSTDYTKYVWSLVKGSKGDKGTDGVRGENGKDGNPTYTWMKFADTPTTGMSDNPFDKDYIGLAYNKTTPIESTKYEDYVWTKFTGEDGINGSDGKDGQKGEDGIQYYNWVKYADTPTSGMSDLPAGKAYLGVAFNKLSKTPSTNYSDYNWSLIKGEKGDKGDKGEVGERGKDGIQGLQGKDGKDGIPGKAGSDGKTSYAHIAYADDNKGGGFSQTDSNKDYVGLYYDFNEKDSDDPTKYKWSLIKGADGSNGLPGKPGNDGKTPYFHVAYANSADGTKDFSVTISDNKSFIGTYSDFEKADSTNPKDYAWSKIKGDKGDTGDKGVPGTPGVDGKTPYLHIKYSNDGGKTFTGSNGEEPGSWMGTYTDFTENDSVDVNKYTWVKVKGKDGSTLVNYGQWDSEVTYKSNEGFIPYVYVYNNAEKNYYILKADLSKNDNPKTNPDVWSREEVYDFIFAKKIQADEIDVDNLTVKRVLTKQDGPRIEIEGTEIKVYGEHQYPNMIMGINDSGDSVLTYYHGKSGMKLYELGASGISWVKYTENSYEKVKMEFISHIKVDETPNKSNCATLGNERHVDTTTYYKFKVGRNPNTTPEMEANDGKIYTGDYSTQSDSNLIADGWYNITGTAANYYSSHSGVVIKPGIPGKTVYLGMHDGVKDQPEIYSKRLHKYVGGVLKDGWDVFWNDR